MLSILPDPVAVCACATLVPEIRGVARPEDPLQWDHVDGSTVERSGGKGRKAYEDGRRMPTPASSRSLGIRNQDISYM